MKGLPNMKISLSLVIALLAVQGRAGTSYIGWTQDQVKKLGTSIGGGMWEKDLAIDIRHTDKQDTLFLIEFTGEYKKQPEGGERKDSKVVDYVNVSIKKDQQISDGASFRCLENQTSVIGVFNKKDAKEKSRFPAQAAWKIDLTAKKLVEISDLKTVSCDWYRNGDEKFPL